MNDTFRVYEDWDSLVYNPKLGEKLTAKAYEVSLKFEVENSLENKKYFCKYMNQHVQ